MLFPVRRTKLLECCIGELSSYSPLGRQRDLYTPCTPIPPSPRGSPRWGPTRWPLTVTGRCPSGRRGLPSCRGAARASRSCWGILGMVPVSPPLCPQPPEGHATPPPTPDGAVAPVATRTPLTLHPQSPRSIPAPRGSPSGRSQPPLSRGVPAHLDRWLRCSGCGRRG